LTLGSHVVRAFQALSKPKRTALVADPAALILEIHKWIGPDYASGVYSTLGEILEDAINLPPKMLRFIADCMDEIYLAKQELEYSNHGEVHRELGMTVQWLPGPTVTGILTTADVVICEETTDTFRLEVWDYKTGSIPVEAAENDQLRYYLYTALCQMLCDDQVARPPSAAAPGQGVAVKPVTLIVRALQPGESPWHRGSLAALLAWAARARDAYSRITVEQSTTLRPGDWCTFCPANPYA